ncbi:MAG: hypothetical protein HN353_05705 [Bdellovibrionales bacterium]|nr:hypothetical protein [Bdellovibrionales bacterium]MBT3525063.1 hypothetical protein [Bdellovibrionales bacterium]MBT7767416.1 hypothetical protein [Bdellovibrionales bacterium]
MQEQQASNGGKLGARTACYPLVPYLWGEGCCRREFQLLYGGRYNIRQIGIKDLATHPEDADLLVISGLVTDEMVAEIKNCYQRMHSHKWVMLLGTTAISGGVFHGDGVVENWDDIFSVDILLPGCPPAPELIIQSLLQLQHSICVGQ